MVNNNFALNTIFSETDPNKIANVVVTEICNIIEYIAPSKKIQCSKSYCPWIDKNFKIQASIRDNLHTIAKSVDTPIAWREYRNQRNLVNRLNKSNKSNYYKSRLNLEPSSSNES